MKHSTRPDSMDRKLAAHRPGAGGGIAKRLELALTQRAVLGGAAPQLGRFEIRRKLGQGGMASVFEAWDPKLSRAIAIKVLHGARHRADDLDIELEAQALARLSDPAVVTIYDIGVEDDQLYVCMALVDGGDAARWLTEHAPVGLDRLLEIFLDAGKGLRAAHEAGIVHRDFKLANLLIGSDGRARVTDFGLARLDGREARRRAHQANTAAENDASVTQAGGIEGIEGIAGTPGFIAPEVLDGGRASPLSDQWSFCTALDKALEHVQAPAPKPLRDLIARGTHPDPTQRFADMSALVLALHEMIGDAQGADRGARVLLERRLRAMWIDGVRDISVAAVGHPLEVRTAAVHDIAVAGPALPGSLATAEDVADALTTLHAGVLIVGPPGAGKTVRLIDVADQLLKRAHADPSTALPVLLNVAAHARTTGDFRAWLEDELVAKYALSRAQVSAWIDRNQLTLLLDGLDELAPPRRDALLRALTAFRADHPLAFVLTSREDEARALTVDVPANVVLRVDEVPLAALQATLCDDAMLAAAIEGDPELAAQLRNPLLLALYMELRAELPPGDVTALRERLYRAAVAHAMEVEPPLSEAARQDALERLRWLARTMRRVGVTELWFEEMQMDWLERRSHRIAATATALVLAFAGAYAVNLPAAWLGGQPTSLGLVWGTASAVSAFAINRGIRIVPMESMGWSWPKFWRWVPFNVGMGVAAGYANSFVSGEPGADMILGGATGLLGMSMIGLTPQGRERRVRPGEGLRESMRNANIVAPLVALLLFFGIGFVAVPLVRPLAGPASMYHTFEHPGLTWGLTMGIAGGYATWLATGMWAPLAHAVLRRWLAATTPMPTRTQAWLDEWTRRGLLRRVGGGWMFRHQTLRTWIERSSPSGDQRALKTTSTVSAV